MSKAAHAKDRTKPALNVPDWMPDASILALPDGGVVAVAIVTFVPELAGRLLATNENNRNLRKMLASRYAVSMAAGMFVFNGQSIILDADGVVLDGQHRLTACTQSGTTFTSLVVFGLDANDTVVASMDTGSGRSRSDMLKIQYGIPYSAYIGTACAYLHSYYRQGGFEKVLKSSGKNPPLSHWQICEIFEEFPESVELCAEAIRDFRKRKVSYGVLTTLRVVFSRYDKQAEAEFFQKLATGAGLEEGHPILALRQTLDDWANLTGDVAKYRATVRSAKESIYLFAVFIKAWNAFCQGESIRRLRWDPNREVFPAIVQNTEQVTLKRKQQRALDVILRTERKLKIEKNKRKAAAMIETITAGEGR